MKKFLIIFIFIQTLIISSISFAEWSAIAKNTSYNDIFYVDLKKIKKIDNKVLWWELRDGPDPVGKKYFSTLHYFEGDCNYFRYKILSQTWVEGRMGQGKKFLNNKPNTKWKYPAPSQTDEMILKYVCEYIK